MPERIGHALSLSGTGQTVAVAEPDAVTGGYNLLGLPLMIFRSSCLRASRLHNEHWTPRPTLTYTLPRLVNSFVCSVEYEARGLKQTT